jgi:hypothetical protein
MKIAVTFECQHCGSFTQLYEDDAGLAVGMAVAVPHRLTTGVVNTIWDAGRIREQIVEFEDCIGQDSVTVLRVERKP